MTVRPVFSCDTPCGEMRFDPNFTNFPNSSCSDSPARALETAETGLPQLFGSSPKVIKTERAVLVCFYGETECLQFVDKFLFSEHFVVGVVSYPLKWYPDPSFPGFERQVLKQKLTTSSQRPVHFRQRIPPIGYVVNDPEIHNEIKSRIRKLEACNIAFYKDGIWQRARFSPGPIDHPRVQIDADVSLGTEQVVDNPGARPLATADLEDIVRRPF